MHETSDFTLTCVDVDDHLEESTAFKFRQLKTFSVRNGIVPGSLSYLIFTRYIMWTPSRIWCEENYTTYFKNT
jgi:hypothetical protein